MSNLDVAVASFWQLARHWKQGDKAKLELTCEDGSLHMQLSAALNHPDHRHFPHPPSSSSSSSSSSLPSYSQEKEVSLPTVPTGAAAAGGSG